MLLPISSLEDRNKNFLMNPITSSYGQFVNFKKQRNTKVQIFYDSTYMRCPKQSNLETESRTLVPRGCGEGVWGVTV